MTEAGLGGGELFGAFTLDVRDDGVGLVTFDRPPVNAVSVAVYEALGALVDRIEGGADVRVVVLTAPADARAWCGGADLNDFVGIDPDARKQRYDFINAQLPRFYAMDRPVIAAINAPAVGIGVILAALCDMRIASDAAHFSCPEIDFGLVAGGAALLALAKMPEARVREMLFTGRRFTAAELEPSGFFNYVVPRQAVLPKALELAAQIAVKSLPAIRARKRASTRIEGRGWVDAYLDAQRFSAALTAGDDGAEGVAAFLDKRPAAYRDK